MLRLMILLILLCCALGACQAPRDHADRPQTSAPRPQQASPTPSGPASSGETASGDTASGDTASGDTSPGAGSHDPGQAAADTRGWHGQRARWQQLDRDHEAREDKPTAAELAAGDAGPRPPKDWQEHLARVLQAGVNEPGTGRFRFYAPAKIGIRAGESAPFEYYWTVYYKVNQKNRFGDYTGFRTVRLFYRDGEWISQRELTHRQDRWCLQNVDLDQRRQHLASPGK